MCIVQTLAYGPEGYIVRCPGCGRLQMAFGVAVVTLSPLQFRRLRRQLAGEAAGSPAAEPDVKCVSVPVSSTLILCLTTAEVQALQDMLDQAAALMEVYQWLEC